MQWTFTYCFNSSTKWPALTCVQQVSPKHPDPHCSTASHDRAHHHRQDPRRDSHDQVKKTLRGLSSFLAVLHTNVQLKTSFPLSLVSDHLLRASRHWYWVPCEALRSSDTSSSFRRFNSGVRSESAALLKRVELSGMIDRLSKKRLMSWQVPSTMSSPTGPGQCLCVFDIVLRFTRWQELNSLIELQVCLNFWSSQWYW